MEPVILGGLKFGQTILLSGGAETVASLYGDLGDIVIKGDKISTGEVLFNEAFSFALGGIYSGLGKGLSKL
jgi:hypothetical protein